MIGLWLRENKAATYLLTLARIWLGYEWLMAGWTKVIGDFSSAGFLRGAVAKATGQYPQVQTWWANFLESFAIPNSALFDFLIPYGEVFVGLGLIVGGFTLAAAFFGVVMNFAFVLSGAGSTNPQMIMVGFLLIYAGKNSARFGVDHWIMPYLHNRYDHARRKWTHSHAA